MSENVASGIVIHPSKRDPWPLGINTLVLLTSPFRTVQSNPLTKTCAPRCTQTVPRTPWPFRLPCHLVCYVSLMVDNHTWQEIHLHAAPWNLNEPLGAAGGKKKKLRDSMINLMFVEAKILRPFGNLSLQCKSPVYKCVSYSRGEFPSQPSWRWCERLPIIQASRRLFPFWAALASFCA